MRFWLLAVVTAVIWSHCILLGWAEGRKARKRPKETNPQYTEAFNSTVSNSEEQEDNVRVCSL